MIAEIQMRQAAREELAAAVADFERKHGPVKTLPIMQRDSTGNFHNIEAGRMKESGRRGRALSNATNRAKKHGQAKQPVTSRRKADA